VEQRTPRTRIDEVMGVVQRQIEQRALTPGARLPSVRAMAGRTGFSVSTVVEAYDRLVSEGSITARAGAGFYVVAPLAPLALAEIGPVRSPHEDPLWLMRQALEARPGTLLPGGGWLPDSWMPDELLRKAMRPLTRTPSVRDMAVYGTPRGAPGLRQLLARRMLAHGIEAAPDQLALTESGTHAIDLILRFLVEPGDTILLDDPCYFNFHALLRAHRVEIVGVPMTPNGPDVAAFEAVLAAHRPRLYITNSAVQNPTGAILSAATAHRILTLAEAHDLVIVEDDIFGDFEDEPAPRLAALDGLQRVIRTGSFSKSLSSAVRLGYIAARPDWTAALADLRIATSLSGSRIAADLIHAMLSDGSYRRHMEKVRARLAVSRQRVLGRLRSIGIQPWLEPSAGIFAWCRLPAEKSAIEIARAGLEEGIIYAPGNAFSTGHNADRYMRINVATADDERVFTHLARACA